MKLRHLRSQSGVTILEVLIASVIFMVGFTTLVALINSTLLKFSTKELTTAGAAAQEVMLLTIANADTTSFDTTQVFSGVRYRVARSVTRRDNLACVRIIVSRPRTTTKIVDLYDAFALPQK
jgi:Tfp pilus assembly protein PilV